nr:hypothetical protein [Tanacetum cinerariifolium]
GLSPCYKKLATLEEGVSKTMRMLMEEKKDVEPKEVVDMKKEVEDEDNDEMVRNIEDETTGDGIEELAKMP